MLNNLLLNENPNRFHPENLVVPFYLWRKCYYPFLLFTAEVEWRPGARRATRNRPVEQLPPVASGEGDCRPLEPKEGWEQAGRLSRPACHAAPSTLGQGSRARKAVTALQHRQAHIVKCSAPAASLVKHLTNFECVRTNWTSRPIEQVFFQNQCTSYNFVFPFRCVILINSCRD